ncbi:MAG: transglutaminase-like cysteine peptidase [Pseudomonadota bacterium]|jgi:predicted transglutaminase-like cysteine proteinase
MDRTPLDSGVRFATRMRCFRSGVRGGFRALLLGVLVMSASLGAGPACAERSAAGRSTGAETPSPAPYPDTGPAPYPDTGADATQNRLERWHQLMREGRNLDERAQLEAVNEFFNGARFVDDADLWLESDYWATPDEFLARDAGDCEDFAIAKYITLKAMGMAPEKLRITYVKVATLQQAHMVLAYYPDPRAEPLILDNLNRRIKPAGERRDLRPIYSFNADSLWLARSRHEQQLAGHPGQLQRWREMLARLDPELRHSLATPALLR